MNVKQIRNILIILGVMAALLPAFLYAVQKVYYGPGFSIVSTTAALACFIAAALVQAFGNKQKGLPVSGPLIIAGGFAFVAIYILLFF